MRPHGYLLPLALLALLVGCGDDEAHLEVSPHTLIIGADASSAEFVVANTGGAHLEVRISGGGLSVLPELLRLDAGTRATVTVAAVASRLSADVVVEGDNGEAVIVDVEVKPLRTETRQRTMVDTQVTLSAGTIKSWRFDNVPDGATLAVSMSGSDDFDTWLEDGISGLVVDGTSRANTLRVTYQAGPLYAGVYTLVVSNRTAWFFSRTVSVNAVLKWEASIQPTR